MKSYSIQYEWQRHGTGKSRLNTPNIVPIDREGLVNTIPVLTSEYWLPSQWIPVLAPTPVYFRYGPSIGLPCDEYLSDKWRSTFTNDTAQLRSITKTVPKSPSLWYGFRRRMSCPVGCEHSRRIGESVRHWGWGKKKDLQKEASNWPLQGKLSDPLWTRLVPSTSALHKCHCLTLSPDYVALGLVLKKGAQEKKIVHN